MSSLYGFDAGAVVAGFGLPGETLGDWVGRTDAEIAEHYATVTGRTAGEILTAAYRHLDTVLADGLASFADAMALLADVERSGTPTAVGSNSDRRRLRRVLSASGLGGRFAVQVSSSDVSRPKPAPDIYLRAAGMLGVEPARCLVVEDSPSGIAAARRAGMFVVAVDRGYFPAEDLAVADRLVAKLHPR